MRALLDLALLAPNDSCTLTAIADRQQISVGYLEQIFSTLRKAGIVIGMKGPQGGYVLARPAERLPVRGILDVLEGDLFAVDDDPVDAPAATAAQNVLRNSVWEPMSEGAAAALAGLTLADLAESYRREESGDNYIYYI